jgi:hypothetical protein
MLSTASGGTGGDLAACGPTRRPSTVLRLAVLGDPAAEFVGVEAAGAADLVAGQLAAGGLVLDPVLVHPEQLGDLADGHHRLHRCSPPESKTGG